MTTSNITPFSQTIIRTVFNRAAPNYNSADILAREVCGRLDERLNYMRMQPTTILDLGAGTGYGSKLLQMRYPHAEVFTVDISERMLQQYTSNENYTNNKVCAASEALSFKDNSFDLILSNLMMPWCVDMTSVFKEMQRVLKPEGLLMFSTLGPDTLHELRTSWAAVDDCPHVHVFFDLHDVGDALTQAHFSDPVMDRETITLTYRKIQTLLTDLRTTGSINILEERRKTLTGKKRFNDFLQEYSNFRYPEGRLPATFEIIYGHAWKTKLSVDDGSGEIRIPIGQILRGRLRG